MISITVFILLVSVAQVLCGDCGTSNIAPCTCDGSTIRCYATHDFQSEDLDQILETIAGRYAPGTNVFNTFELISDKITSLDANIFHGLFFREIKIEGCHKLSCVHPRAFAGLENLVFYFTGLNSHLGKHNKDCNLFEALGSLNVLTKVSITGSEITEIPDNAFGRLSAAQPYLKSIDFSGGQGGKIKRIGKHAFSKYQNLLTIDLSGQQISVIDENAFAFDVQTSNQLTINLEKNKLNYKSFGRNAFETNLRITSLKLGANTELKVLDEDVFLSYLEAKAPNIGLQNNIDLQGCPLDVVEENEWLLEYEGRLNLRLKLTNALAQDGQTIWKHSRSEYRKHQESSGATKVSRGTTKSTLGSSTTRAQGSTGSRASTTSPTVPTLPTTTSNPKLGGACPPANEIDPCKCEGKDIKCVANRDFDLDDVMETIAKSGSGSQDFDTFELISNAVTELPNGVFKGVTFKQLKFTLCPQLACVRSRAFQGMEKTVTQFITLNTNFSDISCDFFGALNGLTALETVNILGSSIKEIPAQAFNGRLDSLTTLDFSGGQGGEIATVGKRAFSSLKGLKALDLSSHKIEKIDDFGFTFDDMSTHELKINLEDNAKTLKGSSFGASSFDVNGRNASIRLGSNSQLKYLDRNVFYAFLQNKNHIDLTGSPLDVVQQNEWLLEFKGTLGLQDKLTNARAPDGQEIWTHTKKEFQDGTEPPTAATAASGATVASTKGTGPTVASTKGTGPTVPSTKGTGPTVASTKGTAATVPSTKGTGSTSPSTAASTKGTGPTVPSTKGTGPTVASTKGTAATVPSTKGTGSTSPSTAAATAST